MVSLIPVRGIGEVRGGDDLAGLVGEAIVAEVGALVAGDIVVVASKVVSKAAGLAVTEAPVAGEEARRLAAMVGFAAGDVELILGQSRAVIRAAPGVLVVETRHGYICANAGIDRSNSGGPGIALLLPEDSDASAADLRDALSSRFGVPLAVLVSDTFGRPHRHGLVNVALGVSGMRALRDYRGESDPAGYVLRGTELAVADELCAAAELVMNKLDRVPVAVIRGYGFEAAAGSGRDLLRDPATDLFR